MSKKRKILFIITYLELGGAQSQLLSIIEGLDRGKYSVYLCSGDRGHLKDKFLKVPFLRVKLIPQLVRNINPAYDPIAFLKLYFYIKKNKFDIIHTHSPKASILGRWAARLAGVKNIVYTVHGWPFHQFMNPFIHNLYLFLERITARITRKIIVVSKADLEKGVKNKIAGRDKFCLVHYGVDINKFGSIYQERSLSTALKGGRFRIVTISALKPQKGLDCFLDAAKMLLEELPCIDFVIAGDGPLRKEIEEKIASMGLSEKVSLKGWHDDPGLLFKEASLFVLTSLWEGLPISLIEAVICGVPAVASDTKGVRDIIKEGRQGFVVPLAAPEKVRSMCLKVLKDYDEWSKIIDNSRKDIDLDYWSKERMVSRTEKVYVEL